MREQTTPTRIPAHRTTTVVTWTGVMLTLALATSIAWYLFWVVMATVEMDIKHIVNWYFFARFNLTTVPHTYEGLQRVGYWMPLLVILIFLTSCIVCPCRANLGKVPPVLYTAVVLHNILMFVYMAVAGGKIIEFFNVILPIQIVFQVHNVWWLVLLTPTLLVFLRYAVTIGLHPSAAHHSSKLRPSSPKQHGSTADTPPVIIGATKSHRPSMKPSLLWFLVVLTLHVMIPFMVRWSERTGCAPCQGRLSQKPSLIAHRGCGFVYPENTILSFVHSSQIPGVVGLETDVQVSYDGVPFLLHDPHTIRTTDVLTKCPDIDPLANASWLNYTSGKCPLEELNVGAWFINEQSDGDTKLPQQFAKELLPTLRDYLKVAKEHEMTVIFDLSEPNEAHPYHEQYINASLKTVISSGISHSKIWWLIPQRRDWVLAKYPDLVQVTKTGDTPFEEFHELKIKVVNDDWGTPLDTLRQYQAANLSINLFFVDSQFAFSYAWCVGAQSVTTNNCKELASVTENKFYQVCYNLRQAIDTQLWPLTLTFIMCSISGMTCFECMQKMRWKRQSVE